MSKKFLGVRSTSVTLKPEVANKISVLSARLGLSRSQLMNLLMIDFCDNYERRKEELGLEEVELYENDK